MSSLTTRLMLVSMFMWNLLLCPWVLLSRARMWMRNRRGNLVIPAMMMWELRTVMKMAWVEIILQGKSHQSHFFSWVCCYKLLLGKMWRIFPESTQWYAWRESGWGCTRMKILILVRKNNHNQYIIQSLCTLCWKDFVWMISLSGLDLSTVLHMVSVRPETFNFTL